jgi:hypothetical protein
MFSLPRARAEIFGFGFDRAFITRFYFKQRFVLIALIRS